MVLNMGPLDCESSTLTTRPLSFVSITFQKIVFKPNKPLDACSWYVIRSSTLSAIMYSVLTPIQLAILVSI